MDASPVVFVPTRRAAPIKALMVMVAIRPAAAPLGHPVACPANDECGGNPPSSTGPGDDPCFEWPTTQAGSRGLKRAATYMSGVQGSRAFGGAEVSTLALS